MLNDRILRASGTSELVSTRSFLRPRSVTQLTSNNSGGFTNKVTRVQSSCNPPMCK